MKVTILGTGGFPISPTRDNTCFIIETDKTYLVDFPKDVKKLMNLEDYSLEDFNDVILTHLHCDHLGDLQSMLFHKKYIEQKKINLYTKKEIYRDLEKILNPILITFDNEYESKVQQSLREYINFIDIDECSLDIKTKKTVHPTSTFAFKLTHRGKTLGYSSDTIYDPSLIEFLKDSDMIIHEATKNNPPGSFNLHTEIKNLEGLPEGIRNKIRVIHYPDGLDSSIKKCKEGDVYLFE